MKNFLSIKTEDANYIAGFVDGEGSFNISFVKRNDYSNNIKIVASFNISQKEKQILDWIKSNLKCGTIRSRKDGVYYYEVQDIKSLNEIIIPFFEINRLKTRKLDTFKVFKEIVLLMSKDYHRTSQGIIRIFLLREKIIVKRNRKLNFQELLTILEKSSETICQT